MPDTWDGVYENLPFERRWFRFEHIVWLLMVVYLIFVSAGLFGRGPMAKTTESSGRLHVQFDRIIRARSQAEVVAEIDAMATQQGRVRLLIEGALADEARIESIQPQPVEQTASGTAHILTFQVNPGSPASVRFVQKVDGVGRAQSRIALEEGPGLRIDQYKLP
jgi:hypothetical protein